MHYLRCLLDEVFGKENFIKKFYVVAWQGKEGQFFEDNATVYTLLCKRQKKKCTPWKVTVERHYDNLNNPDNDSRGEWFSGSISFQEKRSNSAHRNYYTITSPSGIEWTRQWLCDEETMTQHLSEKRIYFGTHPTYQSVPRLNFSTSVSRNHSTDLIENVGTSRSAAKELSQIFDGVAVFDFPKPVSLIQYLIEPIVQDGDWVLDFFAGSGTTAHAVYECQKRNIDCRVVLVQKSEAIIKDTTIAYCSKNSIEPTIFGSL